VGRGAAQYFNPEDVTSLVTQLTEVCNTKDLANDMRTKGFARAKDYSWDITAEKTIETYKKVTQK
jgi:glycosyltransferase involved in cell wall biosynthesis